MCAGWGRADLAIGKGFAERLLPGSQRGRGVAEFQTGILAWSGGLWEFSGRSFPHSVVE